MKAIEVVSCAHAHEVVPRRNSVRGSDVFLLLVLILMLMPLIVEPISAKWGVT